MQILLFIWIGKMKVLAFHTVICAVFSLHIFWAVKTRCRGIGTDCKLKPVYKWITHVIACELVAYIPSREFLPGWKNVCCIKIRQTSTQNVSVTSYRRFTKCLLLSKDVLIFTAFLGEAKICFTVSCSLSTRQETAEGFQQQFW